MRTWILSPDGRRVLQCDYSNRLLSLQCDHYKTTHEIEFILRTYSLNFLICIRTVNMMWCTFHTGELDMFGWSCMWAKGILFEFKTLNAVKGFKSVRWFSCHNHIKHLVVSLEWLTSCFKDHLNMGTERHFYVNFKEK